MITPSPAAVETAVNETDQGGMGQYVTLATTAYKFKRYGECLFAVSQVHLKNTTSTSKDSS